MQTTTPVKPRTLLGMLAHHGVPLGEFSFPFHIDSWDDSLVEVKSQSSGETVYRASTKGPSRRLRELGQTELAKFMEHAKANGTFLCELSEFIALGPRDRPSPEVFEALSRYPCSLMPWKLQVCDEQEVLVLDAKNMLVSVEDLATPFLKRIPANSRQVIIQHAHACGKLITAASIIMAGAMEESASAPRLRASFS